jgi:hypothetical protein
MVQGSRPFDFGFWIADFGLKVINNKTFVGGRAEI